MSTPAEVQKRFDELWADRSNRLWSGAEIDELFTLIRAGATATLSGTFSGHPAPAVSGDVGHMLVLLKKDERFRAAANRIFDERADLLKRLARYEAAEAEEARIQKELDEEHARIEAETPEQVRAALIASGYSSDELEEMAESTRLAVNWYMSEPASKRGWIFAFKAGRASMLEASGATDCARLQWEEHKWAATKTAAAFSTWHAMMRQYRPSFELYEIRQFEDGFFVWSSACRYQQEISGDFKTLEQAQAAALADWHRFLGAALEPKGETS